MSANRALYLATLAVVLSGCATASYETRPIDQFRRDCSNSEAAWLALDTDKDDYLSVPELEKQHAVGLLQDMSVADSDHDGKDFAT